MINDVKDFIEKFELGMLTEPGFHEAMQVRIDHLDEELAELKEAVAVQDKEGTIDALLDLVYIAIGTAHMCGFDVEAHWNEIQRANMSKVKGLTKRGHGYDVKKPDGWTEPNHNRIMNKSK